MKKVKVDSGLRKEPSINRWVKYGVYFQGFSKERRIRFLSSAFTKLDLDQMISPFIKKIITLEQVTNLIPFCTQNNMYGCKSVAITVGCQSQICSVTGALHMHSPVHFVECNFHSFNVFYRYAFKISVCYEKNSSKTV